MMMKKWYGLAAAVGMVLMGAVQTVQAADDYQTFGIRFRAVYVMPDESFDSRLNSLSPELSSNIIPELDLEYFFTKNFSSELILGVTKLNIKLSNQTAGSTYSLPPHTDPQISPAGGQHDQPLHRLRHERDGPL